MFKCKKSTQRTMIQADVEFDHDFNFNLVKTSETESINYILKQRFQRTLKTAKTLQEHVEYVHDCVEETLKLQNKKITIQDLGMTHHNYRSQVKSLFQELYSIS